MNTGLGEHCRRITQSSRDFMETNTFQKLPDDYVRYPGKMDHATMVAFRARGLAAEKRVLPACHPTPPNTPVASSAPLAVRLAMM